MRSLSATASLAARSRASSSLARPAASAAAARAPAAAASAACSSCLRWRHAAPTHTHTTVFRFGFQRNLQALAVISRKHTAKAHAVRADIAQSPEHGRPHKGDTA